MRLVGGRGDGMPRDDSRLPSLRWTYTFGDHYSFVAASHHHGDRRVEVTDDALELGRKPQSG